MPRETIYDDTTQGFYTEVSWRRRPGLDPDDQGTSPGHVQIASVNALSPFHFPDVETEGHFEAGEKFDGWRVTLDEAGIDRLIRTLHKAKRQAFGGEPQYAPGGFIPSIGAATDRIPAVLSEGCCQLVVNVDGATDPQAVARLVKRARDINRPKMH